MAAIETTVPMEFLKDLGSRYDAVLEENQSETLAQFRAQFDGMDAPQELPFNPLEAKYMDLIQMTANEFNASQARKRKAAGLEENDRSFYFGFGPPKHHPLKTRRTFECKLNQRELEILQQHGTVISEKKMSDFGSAYSVLYSNDLPVYISADSILHAWHHSFDSMLEELETHVLSPALRDILTQCLKICVPNVNNAASPEQRAAWQDVTHFFSVPLLLLGGDKAVAWLWNDVGDLRDRVMNTQQLIAAQEETQTVIFGDKPRRTDFSQFAPRGHYTKSEELQQYFQAMMWLGRTEFELSKTTPNDILAAFCVREVINQTESAKTLMNQISALMTNFVGVTDSTTFQELDSFLSEKNANEFLSTNYNHDRDSDQLMTLLNEADIGGQLINSQVRLVEDLEDGQIPRAVTFLGQKFTLDSWAMCKAVFPEDPERRIPSGIDVAYSVFGNETAGFVAAKRMANEIPDVVAHRDGRDVSRQLKSVRQVVDSVPNEFWEASIYGMWVKTLRSLSSTPQTSAAWGVKTLQSQLASWAQLRHDTILYVKQGYTMVCGCKYPDAVVEPNPVFWESVQQMATRTAALIENGYPDMMPPEDDEQKKQEMGWMYQPPPTSKQLEQKHLRYLTSFAETIGTLKAMAERQSRSEPLTEEDMAFLNRICTLVTIGSGGETDWHGWYPELFYGANLNVTNPPILVADVHTDPPCEEHGDPGCIVHAGVGEIRLCYTARLNHGGEPTLYVGPVMMYYEHLTPYNVRLNDEAWKQEVAAGTPTLPEWIQPITCLDNPTRVSNCALM